MPRDNHCRAAICAVAIVAGAALAQGCTPIGVAAGAGAATGVAASQERGIKGAASDMAIRAKLNERWFATDIRLLEQLDMTVSEGRVLLTGIAEDRDLADKAVELAWQIDGVEQVIEEIEIEGDDSLGSVARDTWITTQLRAKLTFDDKIHAVNYSIETVAGTVYLIGVAQDQAELDRVVNHARNLGYVRKVVSHVRLKSDPKRRG